MGRVAKGPYFPMCDTAEPPLHAFGRYWHKTDMPVQSPHVCRWGNPVAKVETCIPLSRAGELIRCVLASDEGRWEAVEEIERRGTNIPASRIPAHHEGGGFLRAAC